LFETVLERDKQFHATPSGFSDLSAILMQAIRMRRPNFCHVQSVMLRVHLLDHRTDS
jgi:hypothetical protein